MGSGGAAAERGEVNAADGDGGVGQGVDEEEEAHAAAGEDDDIIFIGNGGGDDVVEEVEEEEVMDDGAPTPPPDRHPVARLLDTRRVGRRREYLVYFVETVKLGEGKV